MKNISKRQYILTLIVSFVAIVVLYVMYDHDIL